MSARPAASQDLRRQSQWVGVVLLLLLYMAQPVLALGGAGCGCAWMGAEHDCSCSGEDHGSHGEKTPPSCCGTAQPVKTARADSSCGDMPAAGEDHGVCQCPHDPVDTTPQGLIFEAQVFEGPFAWWATLESLTRSYRVLAPHLGEPSHGEIHGAAEPRSRPPVGWDPGDSTRRGPSASRLLNDGLIAFLADLSQANL
ncbi:MAG: hypothetical protein KDB61_07995 [Planctomycetes bacterium]|nr:hypothetical protein [Planctomycetota bacterium]